MHALKKAVKILGGILAFLLLAVIIFCVYVWRVSDIEPPQLAAADTALVHSLKRTNAEGSLHTIGDNWLRHSRYGLYEMYVSGRPFELGLKNGKLSQELLIRQEEAFTAQIRQMIPSPAYLKFLKYIVGFMNRDLQDHVKEEYRQEIYGASFSAADSFDWIGSNYARLLNYHAAHDIGHALQNMMLVGCTSFSVWGEKTEDGSLLVGRNFDFWVGDKFAEHKIVAFYRPEQGYRFAFVTWGGFTGVVSGMNEKGLTVTINAARSDIPYGAATPVSLVAREVLQYAANIEEALRIAHSRKMFVSESFLVSSAADGKAMVIEKTPDTLAVYDPHQDAVLCTNHYQSALFQDQALNREQKEKSASVYRYRRLQQLLGQHYPLTPEKVAAVLRDRRGLDGADIGEGNEKAVNQLIAHHSVIFQPDSLLMWVSTAPWQLGAYVCYDLRKIFSMNGLHADVEIADTARNIAADPFLETAAFRDFLRFRENKNALLQRRSVDTAAAVRSNPRYYDSWRIAGDYCMQQGWYLAAVRYYTEALRLEIATEDERAAIAEKLSRCQKKSGK
jgi:isopenicillin-N N-acyltransferase-like protein